jgi:hypothetical protein
MTIETSRSEICEASGGTEDALRLPVAGTGFSHGAPVRVASKGEGTGS